MVGWASHSVQGFRFVYDDGQDILFGTNNDCRLADKWRQCSELSHAIDGRAGERVTNNECYGTDTRGMWQNPELTLVKRIWVCLFHQRNDHAAITDMQPLSRK
jgi:hypothetical protein